MTSKPCRSAVTLMTIAVLVLGMVACEPQQPTANGETQNTSLFAAAHHSQSAANDNSSPKTSANRSAHMVRVRVFNEQGQLSDPVDLPKVEMTDKQWKEKLTPAQYKILRSSATEPAFCGGLLNNKEVGVYACAGCGLPLFETKTKFESGTGWPSFFEPIAKENIAEVRDTSYGMVRVEITCARCGGHLGHVFEDGPKPTGLRYCTNSDAFIFVPHDKLKQLAEKIPTTQPATQPAAQDNSDVK